ADRRGFRACVACYAKPNLADARLEPERVLAPARADLLGRRAQRSDRRAVLPAVHLLAGRARRPQVLGDPAMVNIFRTLCLTAALAITGSAHAAVRILATTADWGALASELGGDKV